MNIMTQSKNTPHPGRYFRDNILSPKKISITKAAELLHVSRGALTRYVNGKTPASKNMATQIEHVFNLPASTTLSMQVDYDRLLNAGNSIPATAYAPILYEITSGSISQYFSTPAHRTDFPKLVRLLIENSGTPVSNIDFPAGENGERPGFDGILETGNAVAPIPTGKSYWELGTEKDPKAKVKKDFEKRSNDTNVKDKSDSSFVLVASSPVSNKEKFLQELRKNSPWKEVKIIDCSDLEQWIERCPAVQAWMAERLGIASPHMKTLETAWSEWSNVTAPNLPPELFDDAAQLHKGSIVNFLHSSNPIFKLAADTTEEGFAFLSRILTSSALENRPALIVNSPDDVQKLSLNSPCLLIVTQDKATVQQCCRYPAAKVIWVLPKNSPFAFSGDDIHRLASPSLECFQHAWEKHNQPDEWINNIGRQSGYNLWALRCLLAKDKDAFIPEWSENPAICRQLLPFVLFGSWSTDNGISEPKRCSDWSLISEIAGESEELVRQHFSQLLHLPQSPIAVENGHAYILAPLYGLFLLKALNADDIFLRFYLVVTRVLKEQGQMLTLPEKDDVFLPADKFRFHSNEQRFNLARSAALLSAYGESTFPRAKVELFAESSSRFVHEILSPATAQTLESAADVLPLLAETAPQTFLRICKDHTDVLISLMRPVQGFPFTTSPRFAVLSALEITAKSGDARSQTALFTKTVRILEKLAEVPLSDNFHHTPQTVLEGIFDPSHPQTGVDLSVRLSALSFLEKENKTVARHVILNCLRPHSMRASQRPIAGTASLSFVSENEGQNTCSEYLDRLLGFPIQNADEACELIALMGSLSFTRWPAVRSKLSLWADTATEEEKSIAGEALRNLERGFSSRGITIPADAAPCIASLTAAFSLSDVVFSNRWLFERSWPSLPSNGSKRNESREVREEEVRRKRITALKKIVKSKDVSGIIRLADTVPPYMSFQIGLLAGQFVLKGSAPDKLALAASQSPDSQKYCLLLRGLFQSKGNTNATVLARRVLKALPFEKKQGILTSLPFTDATWEFVQSLSKEEQDLYWTHADPFFQNRSPQRNESAVCELIAHGRAKAALAGLEDLWEAIPGTTLASLLKSLPASSHREDKFTISADTIREAIQHLSDDHTVPETTKIEIQLTFLELFNFLPQAERKPLRELEHYLEQRPDAFAQAIRWAYSDTASKEQRHQGVRILDNIQSIPFANETMGENRQKKIAGWIAAVRSGITDPALTQKADRSIGRFFAPAYTGKEQDTDVTEALTNVPNNESILSGLFGGIINARGIVFNIALPAGASFGNGETTDTSGELAEKFKRWSDEEYELFRENDSMACLFNDLAQHYAGLPF